MSSHVAAYYLAKAEFCRANGLWAAECHYLRKARINA